MINKVQKFGLQRMQISPLVHSMKEIDFIKVPKKRHLPTIVELQNFSKRLLLESVRDYEKNW